MARLKRAAILLRSGSHYRSDAFAAGLQRHGFATTDRWDLQPEPGDLLMIWNRARWIEAMAVKYERAGATVVVAENGYLPQPEGGKFYALALERHNGAGAWLVGDRPRYPIPEQPWRSGGDHVLVLPQRGIGSPGVAMPSAWLKGVQARLATITDRPVRIRQHPGARRISRMVSLEDELAGAHCVVTWGSGAGVKAIQAGVPTFHEFGQWIAAPGAARLDRSVEACNMPDRELLWTRISWAQWTLAEIEAGEAFDGLLNAPRGDLFRAGQQPVPDCRERDGGGSTTARDQGGQALLDHL